MAVSKIYYTEFEKELVLVLAKPFLHIIDNKEINGVLSLKKNKVFDEITRQFNDNDGVTHLRTPQQIRQCYFNLKKKLKKSNVSHQVKIKSEPEEVEPPYVEMKFLAEPILKLPVFNPFDSDSTKSEISKSQDNYSTTSDPVIHPITSSQSICTNISEIDASFDPSSMDYNKSEEIAKAITSRPTSGTTPKPSTKFRKTLMMLRKHNKKRTSPSTAARAVACIETEHRATIQNMKNEERRKEQKAKAEFSEHQLRMELLREQIKLARMKTTLHEKLLARLENQPDSISIKST